jgi:hypothetical protein
VKFITTFVLIAFAFTGNAFAHDEHKADEHKAEDTGGHHFVPKTRTAPTAPAPLYSGQTPIDHSNGIVLNKGTYGQRNAAIESVAAGPTWAVSLADINYGYDQKDRFVNTLDERIRHFELAVWNYGKVTDTVSKPEGKAHAEKAAADLNPRIERARDAWSKVKSAGEKDWESAQGNAKRAFIELQSFYYSMHKNVN